MTGECVWKSVVWDVVRVKNEGLSWMGICPGDYPRVLFFLTRLTSFTASLTCTSTTT